MRYCISGKAKGHLASHSILNIFYITRRIFDIEARKEISLMLCEKFNVVGLDKQMIAKALRNKNWRDLEDGLQMQCAVAENLDYIVTRDPKGFADSTARTISPEIFLELLEGKASSFIAN